MAYHVKIELPDGTIRFRSSSAKEEPIDAIKRLKDQFPGATITPLGQPDLTPPVNTPFDLKPDFPRRR